MNIIKQLHGLRKVLIICATTIMTAATATGVQAFDLVTIDEHNEAIATGENPADDFVVKSLPDAPVIKVLSPEVTSGTLSSPVDIEVKFQSAEGADVDMDSLKIYYLMFIKKDVTKRILENAEIGVDSIKAPGAELPSGKHKFLVEISDSKKRKSSQKFVVKVEG